MFPWLCSLCLVLEKEYTIWHFGLSRSPGKKLRGNMRCSKCDEYCIFSRQLFSFYEKVPSPLDPVAFFRNIFT